jgi:hypothetical protein
MIEKMFFLINKYKVCKRKYIAEGSSDLHKKVVLTPQKRKKVALTPGSRFFHKKNGSSDLHIR